jgi:hypothetical protein
VAIACAAQATYRPRQFGDGPRLVPRAAVNSRAGCYDLKAASTPANIETMSEPEITPLHAARDAIEIILELVGGQGDLPDGFWDDPFVLGFVFYIAYAYAIRAGAGDIPFKALRPVYADLLGEDGNAIFSQSMMYQAEEHRGFGSGLEAATKFISATAGQSEFDEDEAVITAHERARETMTQLADDADLDFDQILFVYLVDEIFTADLRRRYPEMAQQPN